PKSRLDVRSPALVSTLGAGPVDEVEDKPAALRFAIVNEVGRRVAVVEGSPPRDLRSWTSSTSRPREGTVPPVAVSAEAPGGGVVEQGTRPAASVVRTAPSCRVVVLHEPAPDGLSSRTGDSWLPTSSSSKAHGRSLADASRPPARRSSRRP